MDNLKIGIVGSGFMAREIGNYLAEQGYSVLMKGIIESELKVFKQETEKIFSKQKRRGKITEKEYEKRISGIETSLIFDDRFSELDLVIESVVEDIDVKRGILMEMEGLCSAEAFICTNSSALSVSKLAFVLKNPERFFGFHFFHPVKFMDLVEIVRGDESSEESVRFGRTFAERIGKKALPVKDSPAFYMNRIGLVMLQEVYYALESGYYRIEDISGMFKKSDFIADPILSTDATGIDVIKYSLVSLNKQIPGRFSVPEIINRMMDAGRLGKKTGTGFYNHIEKGSIDDEMNLVLDEFTERKDKTRIYPFSVEQCLLGMMNESAYCLGEGIVEAGDVDEIIHILPSFNRKGMFRYMDSIGIDTVYEKLIELQEIHGTRFKPAPMIDSLVKTGSIGIKKGKGFYQYN